MNQSTDTKSHILEAYRGIKRLMLQGKLHPGQKLLYRELINLLDMSKTPIINALNRLEQDGFVTSEKNYGYYIPPIEKKEIKDAHEVREALEVKAIERAIELGTHKDFAVLKDKLLAYESYRPHKYDKKKLILNADFHLQIAAISGNTVLKFLLRRNLEHVVLRSEFDNFPPDRMDKTAKEHEILLKYLHKKDIAECTELIKQHIQGTSDEIIRTLSGDDFDNPEIMDFFKDD